MLKTSEAQEFERELNLVRYYREHPVIAAYDLLRVDLDIPQQYVLEDMWTKSYVLLTAGRGTGKCVIGDTLVFTDGGLREIGSLGYKTEVLSDFSCVVKGRGGVFSTSKWYYDGPQKTFILTTEHGYRIGGTADHKVLVGGEEGTTCWKRLEDISSTDYVLIDREVDLWPETCSINEEEALLLGLLIGDGCFRGNKYYLGFANGDEQVRGIYRSLGEAVFGFPPNEVFSLGKCPDYRYTRKEVWDKLECWGVTNNITSGNKYVPPVVMGGTKTVASAFLCGLFEADGGSEKKNKVVSYTSKSVKLARQVQMLLLNFGIVGRLKKKKVIYKGEPRIYWTITVSSHNVDKYIDEVGFISSRKKKEARGISEGIKRNPNLDVVPGLSSVFYKMWDKTKGVISHQQRERLKRYKYGYELPTYSSLTREIKKYPFDDEFKSLLIGVVERNYLYDRVGSVEEGFEEVYDLVVPEGHSFVANGFVNHNTFLNAVMACLSALLYPGQRVGLLAPSFRQAKLLFAEVDKMWQRAPLLQEATANRPIRASDRCYLSFRQSGFSASSVIEAVPLGDGCLTGCNHLTFSDKFGTISDGILVKDLEKDHQVFRKSSEVWSNGEFRFSDEKYYNGIKDTKIIKTCKGYSVEGTFNHRIKILRDTKIVFVRLDELKLGDRILIDRTYRWHNAPEEISSNSAYVLGLMIGDGCWTQVNRMSFSTLDIEFISKLKQEFAFAVRKTADGVHWNIQGLGVKEEWLSFWGLKDLTYAKDKCLPPKLLAASREAMAACISGLYDTDGHVQVGRKDGGIGLTVGFTNTSKVLIDQLHYILLHYGIVAYKTHRDRDEKWNRVYELLITGDNVKRFAECIGFRLKRKSDMLWSALHKKKRIVSMGDYIPGVLSEMISFRKTHLIRKGCGTKGSRHIRASCLESRKEASRADVAYFIQTYSDTEHPFLDTLKELSDPSIYYDEVVEIVDGGKQPTYDIHVPDGHEYCASGFFSHNTKIRGARYYLILADEFAQIPESIFNTVILPMGATVAEPMENVKKIARERELIRSGLATKDDFKSMASNKVIMSSSAFYRFNHMYLRKCKYEELAARGDPDYITHTISFRDMSEGFLEEKNIINAQATLSDVEFLMEYEAVWKADSAGVFKASLFEKCRKDSDHTVLLEGSSGAEYVLGVDPARASDAFALFLIEIGSPNKVVAAWEFYQNVFPKMARTIMNICDKFNVVAILMDAGAGGGGLAMKDLLGEEERWGVSQRILDDEDEEFEGEEGRHILYMFNPSPKANAEAVYACLNLLEQGSLYLPNRPQPKGSSEGAFNSLDEEEEVYDAVEDAVRQAMLIEVSESKSGVAHFDVPTGGGHSTQKKDLFTAFVLASKKTYDLMLADEDEETILEVGIIENRVEYQTPIDRQRLTKSLEVTPAPVNSWAFRKTFKP